jgi:hypothetical protein
MSDTYKPPHWMQAPHCLSFMPQDVLEMKSVPADYVLELVQKAWPGEAVFISRKVTNHEAQLIMKKSCEVIATWGSNREAFIQLWEDARHGTPLKVKPTLGVMEFKVYRKTQLKLLQQKIHALFSEAAEWLEGPEYVELTHTPNGPVLMLRSAEVLDHTR